MEAASSSETGGSWTQIYIATYSRRLSALLTPLRKPQKYTIFTERNFVVKERETAPS